MAQQTEWTCERVRKTFIDYFVGHAHTFVPSSAVVPYEDPTLLFTNAGMNQFKPIFLGTVDPKSAMGKLKRAVNSQKCIRAGGKHNDLEDVGRDVYHHTFFEMLGNWSFGDYFKKEAIDWAWDLLVNVYKIDSSRLYATYFGGNKDKGLEPDNEARQIWLKYLPESRVLPFGMKENFWEMGDTGPCGPCTEIHYDRIGGGRDAAKLVNMDDPDVLEIWNNVFIQFNREDNGELRRLPASSVDTGMGFERLTSVLQHKRSNYDTDIFANIFAEIQKQTGAEPYTALVGDADKTLKDMAYRVVADHIRTLTFALTDGAIPSNEGRGYVLRRILRRAVRYGKQMLNAPQGFFHKLCPVVFRQYSDFFPELVNPGNAERVTSIIKEEEDTFNRTLENGLKEFEKRTKGLPAGGTVSGDDAAMLYDTFGFPLDLTQLMARERGLVVDTVGYEAKMNQLREIARNSGKTAESKLVLGPPELEALAKDKVPPTDDLDKFDWVTIGSGRDHSGTVQAIYTGLKDGFQKEVSGSSGRIGVVVDRTSFYAESGGQVADEGVILGANGAVFHVQEVQKFGNYILHIGTLTGKLSKGEAVTHKVDYGRRALTAKNHTTTHALNFALRAVLGEGKDQKGSVVDPEKARFDFSHNKPLTIEEIKEVERVVQAEVDARKVVYKEILPLNTAISINGLRAVFGEQYPDPVRVVSIGQPISAMVKDPANAAWRTSAVEFCGGTHLDNIGEAETFRIISEEGIAKGVRRIVSFTHDRARRAESEGAAFLKEAKDAQKESGAKLSEAFKRLQNGLPNLVTTAVLRDAIVKEIKNVSDLELKEKREAQGKAAELSKEAGANIAREAKKAGAKFVVHEFDFAADLQSAITALRKELPELPALLVSQGNFIADVPADKVAALSGDEWAKVTLAACGGKGGGKGARGQGSTKELERVPAGLEVARKLAAEKF